MILPFFDRDDALNDSQCSVFQQLDRIEFFELTPPRDCPIRVCAAVLPADPRGTRRLVSGCGTSWNEARARCLSEATERALSVCPAHPDGARGSYASLRDEAVYPPSVSLFSAQQYDRRERLNRALPAHHHIPQPFDEALEIEWLEAADMISGHPAHVPAAMCYLGYPSALEQGFPVPDSAGLACGSTLDQAGDSALLELVERDAVAIWWYNCIPRPPVAVQDRTATIWPALVDWAARCGRKAWLLDLTHDLGVAVVAALSSDGDGGDLALGFGAGWTADDAVGAAARELVQFEVTKAARRSSSTARSDDWVGWAGRASLAEHKFLAPDALARPLPAATRDRAALLDMLRTRDLPCLTVTMFTRDGGPHVVRAVVPGLRPLWPRFAPGRLYDVPQTLGWTGDAKSSRLNPVPILY